MIVNLEGTVAGDKIEFKLPMIYFIKDHCVKVNELFIEWKSKVSYVNGYLISTLVEKSMSNPNQQLLFFHNTEKSYYLHVTPTQNAWYKIQNLCLESAVFELKLSEEHKIEKIYLQLEIVNERFQPLH